MEKRGKKGKEGERGKGEKGNREKEKKDKREKEKKRKREKEKKRKREKEKKRRREEEKQRKREKGKKRTQGKGGVSSSISRTFLELRSSSDSREYDEEIVKTHQGFCFCHSTSGQPLPCPKSPLSSSS